MGKIGETEVLRSSTWGSDPRAAPELESRFGLTKEQMLPGEELIGIWTYVPPIPMGNRWWPLSVSCWKCCDWYTGCGAYCCYKAKWNEPYPPGLPWLVRPHLLSSWCPGIATGVGEPVFQGWPWCKDSECFCPTCDGDDKPVERLCCLCPPDGCACLWCRCVCWPKLCCNKYSKGHMHERMHIDELSLDKDMRDVEARVPFSLDRLVLTTKRAVFVKWDEARDLKKSQTLWRKDMDTVHYEVQRVNPKLWSHLGANMKKDSIVSKVMGSCFEVMDIVKSLNLSRFCLNAADEKRLNELKASTRYDFFVNIEFFWKLSSHQMRSPDQDREWRVQTLGDDIESIRMGLERFITGEGNYVKPASPPPPLRMQIPVGMMAGGVAGSSAGTGRVISVRPPTAVAMTGTDTARVAPAPGGSADAPVAFRQGEQKDD